MNQTNSGGKLIMPAEWDSHRATWIAWPHLASDFPGKIDTVRWAFVELIRQLSQNETVEILCANKELQADCLARIKRSGVTGKVRTHLLPYERTWLRDSAPTFVRGEKPQWIQWSFNAWAKYDNFGPDKFIPDSISKISALPMSSAIRPDKKEPVILEGGAFDVDGEGSVLVTEECLLSTVQERNPGLTKASYEKVFAEYLGATNTIWLKGGCAGDDTHGHIDDLARFVSPKTIVCAVASKEDSEQYEGSQENLSILKSAKSAKGKKFEIVELPYPTPLFCDDARLPASYMNFYIANDVVVVPTFNDEQDRLVLGTLSELMPDRKVVGIHCVDWVLGYGSVHCSTQQEPE